MKYIRRDPISRYIDEINRRQMEEAVYRLDPISYSDQKGVYDIHFLSGKRFWYQTCFCAYSLAKNIDLSIKPVIYDDGTLEPLQIKEIKRIFPGSNVFSREELERRINLCLPHNKFPYLHERRKSLPIIRKLTDIHGGSTGWKLYLDSDMLFFREPIFLSTWLKKPNRPCYMVDVVPAYGYSESLMVSLVNNVIPERVNTGITGLNSRDIDWEKLEYWCKTMIQKERAHYYQEQAMTAMLLAGRDCDIAPANDYIVLPSRKEVMNPKAVLHHYVANSKPWYFRYGWKHFVAS